MRVTLYDFRERGLMGVIIKKMLTLTIPIRWNTGEIEGKGGMRVRLVIKLRP